MKRILSLLLVLFLLSILFCSTALAAAGGSCGSKVNWSYSNFVLTISGTGNMTNYSGILETVPWYSYRDSIEYVRIQSGVTSIGDHAFDGLSQLKSVTIAGAVTDIGEYAFKNCTALKEIAIPPSVSGIWFGAFHGSGLTSVTLPAGVELVDCWAFKDCASLTQATILNPDCAIGDSDHDVFLGAADGFTIRGFTDSTAQTYASEAGIPFEALPLSGSCGSNLTWTYIPATGRLTITGTGMMTYFGLEQSVPWYSFRSGIRSVEIGNGVTTISDNAFRECSSLTDITIPQTVIKFGPSCFKNCLLLSSVTIPSGVTGIPRSAFEGCSRLASVSIPSSVTSINDYAFSDCASLTEVTIPDSVTSLGMAAFYGCRNLSSVTLSSNLTRIYQQAFGVCSSLTSITIPDSVLSIAMFAFSECSSLTDIVIPASVTAIGTCAFRNCGAMTDATVLNPETQFDDNVFLGSTPLTLHGYVDSTAQTFAKEYSGITFMPMAYPMSAPDFTLPSGLTRIESEAFAGGRMTVVYIPDGVTYLGDGAFADCMSLTQIRIPVSITSIPSDLFENIPLNQLIIYCAPGSAAETFAQSAGILCGPD